jgi:hypothetical protein
MNDMPMPTTMSPAESFKPLRASEIASEIGSRQHPGNLLEKLAKDLDGDKTFRTTFAVPPEPRENTLFAAADRLGTEFERRGDQAVKEAEDFKRRNYEAAKEIRETARQQDEKRAHFVTTLNEALLEVKSVQNNVATFGEAAE